MQPPPNRPPVPPPPVRMPLSNHPVSPRPEAAGRAPNPDLPTMADLDRLQEQLDAVDQTLADLDLVGA